MDYFTNYKNCCAICIQYLTTFQMSLTLNKWMTGFNVMSEFFSHRSGCEVVRLKAPLFTVGFIIEQVLLHDLIFRVKQEVTVCTRHRTPAVVHWHIHRLFSDYYYYYFYSVIGKLSC